MRSPHPVLHSRASSLLPRSACHSSALKSSTFNTSEFKFQTVFANKETKKQQNPVTLSTSYSSVCGPERFSSSGNPCLTLLTHLSFFLFCLSMERVPSPPWHHWFSHPQLTSIHPAPAILCPSNRGDPSASSQINFQSVPSYLTSTQLCLRD